MKKRLIRIIVSSVLYIVALLINVDIEWIEPALYIASFVVVGWEVVWKACRNIIRGKVFDENFLMSLASIGAFFVGEFPEAAAVMLFYQVGELFESFAVNRSRKSIAGLMDIRPDYANLKKEGKIEKVDPEEVHIGDIIVVSAGEKIPLDGTIIEGASLIDTSALTGESVPRTASVGDQALSGCVNGKGVLTIEVTKEFGESTVSKILDLVENASSKKSKSENFITKFAAVYTPIVTLSALALAVIPPLILPGASFSDWLYRALTFLVVSCPCALVISVPLGFFGGIGGASKAGVLVKGSNYLESLANAEIVVFDKTGTLTKGVFEVQKIYPETISAEELLEYTAYAESYSNHPISLSLKRAYGKEIDQRLITDVEEISGHGVSANVMGKKVNVGNTKLMKDINVTVPQKNLVGTVVYIAIEGSYAGCILIADQVKEDAALAISNLKKAGIKRTVMLTGDTKEVGEMVAADLNLDKAYTDLLPGDKVDHLEELLEKTSAKGKLVFVGDGINDAPVLARADIGIAMGGLGSDAAIEAADIVIMTDEPSKISTAIDISKKTLRIVKQNIVFALAIKIGVLGLAAIGLSSMWEAVFADVGVAVLAILNSMRCLKSVK